MTNKEVLAQISQIRWWHSIALPLPDGEEVITPGEVNHCSAATATNRFGIPEDLTGKSILDIGCWDGYFSFLAESRGAGTVYSIDPYQGFADPETGQRGYKLAHSLLKSRCKFWISNLEKVAAATPQIKADIVFYFGILYHVDHPLKELEYLFQVTNEFALIETAISTASPSVPGMWQFLPGNRQDATNKWYPSLSGLITALKYVGFSDTAVIYADDNDDRVTVKAIK